MFCARQAPHSRRFSPNGSATFAEIVAAGNRYSQSALGYRRAADGEVVLNPAKAERLRLSPEDEVVVVTTRESRLTGDPS